MKLVKQPQRLFVQIKKAVLREDLMKLTDDVVQAMVLGQMIYWTKTLDRVNDWLFEENKRLAEAELPQHEYNYGWIWKSAREMRDDLMGAFSEDAIQRAFTTLASRGILMKRNNPYVKYDRKLHYRIDLVLLRRLLRDMGFEMVDFQLASIPQEAVSIPQGAESIPQGAETITESIIENTNRELPLTPSKGNVESSAMASRSTNDSLQAANAANGADAQVGKADALSSRPPNSVNTRTPFRAPKSPPTKPADISDETWAAWCDLRKAKRAAVTAPVIAMLRKEADKAGWSLNSAMEECVLRNWQGFKADWLQKVHRQESQQ